MRIASALAAGAAAASIGAVDCLAQARDHEAEASRARAELCRKLLCRAPSTPRIHLKDGRVAVYRFAEPSPIVLPNGWVTVFPGEDVHIALHAEADRLGEPRAVAAPGDALARLSFRFKQDPESGDSYLEIESTLSQAVKFDLGMMLPDSEHFVKTSSCPVRAGARSVEHWPHPIFQLVAARFRIVSLENAKCE